MKFFLKILDIVRRPKSQKVLLTSLIVILAFIFLTFLYLQNHSLYIAALPDKTTQQLITFDDLPENQSLLKGYPNEDIDWHEDSWVVAKTSDGNQSRGVAINPNRNNMSSITFGPNIRVDSLDAYNSGSEPTTITLECALLPNQVTTLASNESKTIQTNWDHSCTFLSITSINGGYAIFDNFKITKNVK